MINASTLSHDLGGRWLRRYGTAPCPCCQPERRRGQNALTLADGLDGRLLLNCKKSACDFVSILAAAGVQLGDYQPPDPSIMVQRKQEEWAEAKKRAQQAERCWQEAQPIAGSNAERYLRQRGITAALPDSLRFHPNCWHGPTGKRQPALVGKIEGVVDCAVHRTYLRLDGTSKADLDGGNKLMLGAVAGGAVRLTEAKGPLVVAEGIETGLSLASGLLDRPATIWAALSTSGIRGLRLPSTPGLLTIATDGDPAGADAGHNLAERAYALGWAVSLLPAPAGGDWNDVLTGKAELT